MACTGWSVAVAMADQAAPNRRRHSQLALKNPTMGLVILRTFKNLPIYPIEFAMLQVEIKSLAPGFLARGPLTLNFQWFVDKSNDWKYLAVNSME